MRRHEEHHAEYPANLTEAMPIVTGHRVVRGFMYLAIALAGVAVFFIPLAFLDRLVDATIGLIGAFLVIGGLISGTGHIGKILVVERAGYPLVLSATSALTIILFAGTAVNPARTFIGLLVLAFTLGLYGRWRDLGVLLKIQRLLPGGEQDDTK